MSILRTIGFVFCLGLFFSCSGSDDLPPVLEPLPDRAPPKLPVTEALQLVHLPHHQAWNLIHQVLGARNIRIESSDLTSNSLYTKWEKISDSLCGTRSMNNAPLPCTIRLFATLQPKTKTSTMMHLRYVENCLGQGQSPIECPESNAEKLLMTIVDDVRSLSPKPE